MINFEFYNLILYLKKESSQIKYKQYYINKVKSNVFGYVYGPYTFDFLNIFMLKGPYTLTT